MTLLTGSSRENLALLGSGVLLALLHPDVGLAGALFGILW